MAKPQMTAIKAPADVLQGIQLMAALLVVDETFARSSSTLEALEASVAEAATLEAALPATDTEVVRALTALAEALLLLREIDQGVEPMQTLEQLWRVASDA
jgi:hypothetical protein